MKKYFKDFLDNNNNFGWETSLFIYDEESNVEGLLKNYRVLKNYEEFFIFISSDMRKSIWYEYSKIVVTLDSCETGNGIYSSVKNFKYGPLFKELFILKDGIVIWYRKNLIDRTPLPCPLCNEYNVKSNSWTNVGYASWECHNPLCKRSESNRGKRFNWSSLLMDNVRENTKSNDYSDFSKDLNLKKSILEFEKYIKNHQAYGKNSFKKIKIEKEKGNVASDIRKNFAEIIVKEMNKIEAKTSQKTEVKNFESFIFNGDAKKASKIIPMKVDMVLTSPPYYNAREYSQWGNIIKYLADMTLIAREVRRLLNKTGTYIYNIGDIMGNTNMITSSKMDHKRLQLAAYSIFCFQLIGLNCFGNVLWNKIEPQSKKKFSNVQFEKTHRPMNVYEHNLIFKTGKLVNNNITAFNLFPVKKINSKGENIYGHTAPFPEELPRFFIEKFAPKSILDPFLGSGTTIIAAKKMSIKAFGIEKNGEYFKLAIERIKNVEI